MISVPVTTSDAGRRLDHFLQASLPQFSRSRLQEWIKDGRVLVNAKAVTKTSLVLKGTEAITVEPAAPPPLHAVAEDLPVEVLYEDADVVAVNKPAGIVVHAGAGNHKGTLVNRLVHRFETLSSVGGDARPGIVHRLDKDTSGVILVAKNDAAHRALAEQFSSRTTEKIYLALVQGLVKPDADKITLKISRDPQRRVRMSAREDVGRTALTEYKVQERFAAAKCTYLRIRIGTGRTHQIRVHMSTIGHPIVGDGLYGGSTRMGLKDRFFLHAHRIRFDSPTTGERITVEAPLPDDLAAFLKSLS
ncbi:pseudouridine synthase [Bryobacterales bacterium F-183]|nr:pseudouridine synthase [Bryobacterales bacterium F-183]